MCTETYKPQGIGHELLGLILPILTEFLPSLILVVTYSAFKNLLEILEPDGNLEIIALLHTTGIVIIYLCFLIGSVVKTYMHVVREVAQLAQFNNNPAVLPAFRSKKPRRLANMSGTHDTMTIFAASLAVAGLITLTLILLLRQSIAQSIGPNSFRYAAILALIVLVSGLTMFIVRTTPDVNGRTISRSLAMASLNLKVKEEDIQKILIDCAGQIGAKPAIDNSIQGRLSLDMEGASINDAMGAICSAFECEWKLSTSKPVFLIVTRKNLGRQVGASILDRQVSLRFGEKKNIREIFSSCAKQAGAELAVDEDIQGMYSVNQAGTLGDVIKELCNMADCSWEIVSGDKIFLFIHKRSKTD